MKTKINPNKQVSVEIFVTDALVKKGTPNDDQACPVALALQRVCRKGVEIEAGYEHLTFDYVQGDVDHGYHQIATPARVAKFMAAVDECDPNDIPDEYDAEGELMPKKIPARPKAFTFKVKIPNKFLKPSFQE